MQLSFLFFLLSISQYFIFILKVWDILRDSKRCRGSKMRAIKDALLSHLNHLYLFFEALNVPADIIGSEALIVRHLAYSILRHYIILYLAC